MANIALCLIVLASTRVKTFAYLLSGPTLGPSLLGVLIRFREHQVAISGNIKGMFHQIRLLPTDRPLLSFL